MHKKLLIATTNIGKRKEISDLLKSTLFTLITPNDISLHLDVEENGSTYKENAHLKAKAYSRASGLPVLADDSGLEVAVLDGQPGLHSARFSSDPNATDRDRRDLLLSMLTGYPRPWIARFVCSVILMLPNGKMNTCEATCNGEIVPDERGNRGFGYDPIFLFTKKGKTMAELSLQEKNRISHRAKAVAGIIPFLNKL